MKPFWTAELAPEDLLRAFLRSTGRFESVIPEQTSTWRKPSNGKCFVIWDRDPKKGFGSPAVIVADPSILSLMVPRILAVPGGPSPLTSFCRLWETGNAEVFFRRHPFPIEGPLLSGLVGLCIGEVFSRNGAELDLRRLGQAAVSRTLAHSCSKLIVAGTDSERLDSLYECWLKAAVLTRNVINDSLLSTVAYLSKFLVFIGEDKGAHATPALLLASQIEEWLFKTTIWYRSSPLASDINQFVSAFKSMPRELRFSLAERTLVSVRNSVSTDKVSSALLSGFILALIDPGSLDFFDIAMASDDGMGSVACAYTMCAGLLGGAQFLWKGDGFGIALVSKSLQPQDQFLQASPDISLKELTFLQEKITESGFEFRTKAPTVVEVELLPDITGVFPNGARRDASAVKTATPQTSLFFGVDASDQLGKAADLATDLANRLHELRLETLAAVPAKKRRMTKSRQSGQSI
jgi:hypothetical protein